ncbi:MAG TPA: hypothetical protein VIL46_05875 [Gemmataceae bacterium]
MTVFRAFAIILGSGFAFAAGGALIGYTLAVAIPQHYRGVFRAGRDPEFDPVSVGFGLGLAQGLIAGLVIGCVVVLAVTWYSARHPLAGGRADG